MRSPRAISGSGLADAISSRAQNGERAMTIIESGSDRLVVQAGSLFSKATLTLDKKAGRASVENGILMWRGKPREIPIAEIAGVDLLTFKDALSGADTHKPALRTHVGEVIGVPSGEAGAVQTMQKLREFLGIGGQGDERAVSDGAP